jgi:FkbM family methyltransferase
MLTANEVFCREDYRAATDIGVAVDIGSNIGISALYFLSRDHRARAYLYEPDPRNLPRLRRNLQGFEGRYSLEPVAVDVADGEVPFSVEPTGRYGRIGVELSEQVTVTSRAINAVLADVLAVEEEIDVLKVDTEGTEERLVGAIEPSHLDRIAAIYYETSVPAPLHDDRFEHRFACETNVLRRRHGGSRAG